MQERAMSHYTTAFLALGAILSVGTSASQSFGQSAPSSNVKTSTDAYGNARGVYNPRRVVGSFANDTQRMRLRGFQSEGRRALRRGGDTPFALPSDRILYNLTRRPFTRANSSADYWQTRRAFTRYGILGTKRPSRAPTNPADLLGRKSALLRATSATAPVKQSLMLRGSTSPRIDSLSSVPAAPYDEGSSIPPVTLGDLLQTRLADSARDMRARGWLHFEEGEYGRAVRAFESEAMLKPKDIEPRIAEVFCYLSIGSFRTAAASLEQLAHRDAMLFTESTDFAAHYSEQADLRRIRIQCRLFSQGSQRVPRGAALYPFFLWYVGEYGEALSEATVLARTNPDTDFADWPRLMREASESRDRNQSQQ